jgi:hypothetical protein
VALDVAISVYDQILRPFMRRMRGRRMQAFVERMKIKPGLTVLDLGGQPDIWAPVGERLDITILNLPGVAHKDVHSHHAVRYVDGDACNVVGLPQFDIVFSNSVIEHVGDASKRSAFAREVRRLGRAYWVQTPSPWFPLEPHTGMPFWWAYPNWLRQFFLARWRKRYFAWADDMAATTFLTRRELRSLFPEATIKVERFLGIPKSYICFHPGKG